MKHAHTIFMGIIITGFIALNGMTGTSNDRRTLSVDPLNLDGEDAAACPSCPPAVPQRADLKRPEAPPRSDLQPAAPTQYDESPPRSPRNAPTFEQYIDTSAVQDHQPSPRKSPPARSRSRAAAHGSGVWDINQRPEGTKRQGDPEHQSMRRGERNGRVTIEELIARKQSAKDNVPQSIQLYFVNDSAKKLRMKIFAQEGDQLYPVIQRTTETKRITNVTKPEKVPYDGNEMLISLSRVEIPAQSIFALTVDASKPAIIFFELEDKSLMSGKKLAIHSFPNRALVYGIAVNDTNNLTYDGQSKPIISSTIASVERWMAHKISKSGYTVYHFAPNIGSNGALAAAYAERSEYVGLPTLKSYD